MIAAILGLGVLSFLISWVATFAMIRVAPRINFVDRPGHRKIHSNPKPLGGGVAIVNMMLGEVAPGGVGSGLYGMLVLAVVTVFIAGLMVGRTPEYLGKKLGGREVKFASLYLLTTPAIVLTGTALAMALPGERAAMLNRGPHGLT